VPTTGWWRLHLYVLRCSCVVTFDTAGIVQRCHSCVRVVAQHQANCKHQALCRDAEALPPGIEETPAAEFAANVPVLTAIAALNIGMCCAVLCCAVLC
jgi:hypothetical protein